MKFTITPYLVLFACLATTLALPIQEEGIAISNQTDTSISDSLSGAYAELAEPGTNSLQAGTDLAIL